MVTKPSPPHDCVGFRGQRGISQLQGFAGLTHSIAMPNVAMYMTMTERSMRILVIAVLACLTTPSPTAADDQEANKLLIRSYIEEMWNKHQPSAADRFVATDFVEHNPRLPQGLAGTKQFVTKVLAAFSNYHGELQDLVAEG